MQQIFLNFLFCIGVYPLKNVVIVLGGQQRNSAIHEHVSILPLTPLYHITLVCYGNIGMLCGNITSSLPPNAEWSCLCYTVGTVGYQV